MEDFVCLTENCAGALIQDASAKWASVIATIRWTNKIIYLQKNNASCKYCPSLQVTIEGDVVCDNIEFNYKWNRKDVQGSCLIRVQSVMCKVRLEQVKSVVDSEIILKGKYTQSTTKMPFNKFASFWRKFENFEVIKKISYCSISMLFSSDLTFVTPTGVNIKVQGFGPFNWVWNMMVIRSIKGGIRTVLKAKLKEQLELSFRKESFIDRLYIPILERRFSSKFSRRK